VDFFANGSLVGTDTASGYSYVWTNVPHGVYNVIAKATDNSGASTTSASVLLVVMKSPGSVNHARTVANDLIGGFDWTGTYPGAGGESGNSPVVVADLDALALEIQQAYNDFTLERNLFGSSSDQIATQLMAAYYFARADAALAAENGAAPNTKAHLQRLIGHLAITEDLMRYNSITPATVMFATLVGARMDLVIGAANPGLGAVGDGQVSPGTLASIYGNAAVAPLTTNTGWADLSASSLPSELEGLSLSIEGRVIPVFYASPGQLMFFVPTDLSAGEHELIVVAQTGHLSKGVINVTPNLTRIMTASGDENGNALAFNDAKQVMEPVSVTTRFNLSDDKRTRLTLFVTGVSGNASNNDSSNDVNRSGTIIPNFAESVVVEARTQDNRVYQLPVEFAGARNVVRGLDQVNVVLVPQLEGSGTVNLTMIVNGRRSNTPTIIVQ
jgi:uncharacterized protein (TIGR03437 family)